MYMPTLLLYYFSISLYLTELDFRGHLVATEQELMQLRVSVRDYQSQRSHRERAQREASRLKGIITSQEKQVSTMYIHVLYI